MGASLAGTRAAAALRRNGFDGELVVLGAENEAPYDRPPLSKRFLAGSIDEEKVRLRLDPAVEAALRLETRVERLDPVARELLLTTGERAPFDGLVIATGASPRTLPSATVPAGVFALRTLSDCLALHDALAGARRVAVVGAGFIGLEVAATCRGLGLDVTVIEALDLPLGRVLPEDVGKLLAALHQDHGVELRLGVGVAGLEGATRVEGVRLADGSRVPADVVVVGIGVVPATDWLAGSGIVVDDGVVCDRWCRATGTEGVVAAGDVARWHHEGFGEDLRVEHWTNAAEQGDYAARSLLAWAAGASIEPFTPVPYFWSEQFDNRIQFLGRGRAGDVLEVVEGSSDDGKFVMTFRRDGRLVGVFMLNMPHRFPAWNKELAGAVGAGPRR